MFAGLRTFDRFRYFSLLTINEDIVLVTRQFADHRLTFSPHEYIGRSLFKDGHYQRDLADRVLEIIGQTGGRTLLEIGANIGTHSVYLTRSGRFDRLVCIEPAPDNIQLLKQNLSLNGLMDGTAVIECAVGDHNGVVDFYFDEKNSGAGSVTRPGEGARSVQVPLRRVDEILREVDVSPDDIGLVWMDIEGAEPAALRSMRDLLERRVPILMEYVPSRYEPSEASEMAADLAQYFGRCVVFSGKSERDVDIRNLPSGTNDILFLPK
ncbi:FkbM family methyltransferase [Mesorhizobium sp. 113-3-9]|uniref:FkbM family methyltransferase n=1 Tax=Mesorhizobium sp. 113-3-9 TaxID=2744517 RepID=UPI001925C056|nr:FkbM family methyltransferase [Mesorhizobium sp. 113-3-9]